MSAERAARADGVSSNLETLVDRAVRDRIQARLQGSILSNQAGAAQWRASAMRPPRTEVYFSTMCV